MTIIRSLISGLFTILVGALVIKGILILLIPKAILKPISKTTTYIGKNIAEGILNGTVKIVENRKQSKLEKVKMRAEQQELDLVGQEAEKLEQDCIKLMNEAEVELEKVAKAEGVKVNDYLRIVK